MRLGSCLKPGSELKAGVSLASGPQRLSVFRLSESNTAFHSEVGGSNFLRYAHLREVIKHQPHFNQCA